MISRVAVGDGNAAHAGGLGRQHAFLGVFEDDALGWNDAKALGGFEKNLRRRFNPGDVRAADDSFKTVGDAQAMKNAVDGIPVGRRREADAKISL